MIILELAAAFIITFIILVFSVYKGIFLAYPLIAGTVFFSAVALKRGYKIKELLVMAYNGGKKSLIVIRIFVLIGAIMAIWMASGTVPAIVYYGVKLLKPDIFILSAFMISCFVSFLIGTSVGTSGTAGIALIVIAKSGGSSVAATAGAVIAGAFFGDRCSPMSSSASLVAYLTETNIYDNIKNMFRTSIVPFIISIIFYYILSGIFPLHSSANIISGEIMKVFSINVTVLLPALIIIIFSLFKVNVKISMIISIISAFLISIFIQNQTILNCIKFIVRGYSMNVSNPLYSIIKGGGIISMLKTSFIIYIASVFSGIIEGTGILDTIENLTLKADMRSGMFKNMIITSFFTAAVGCSQVFAVILTHMLNKKAYKKNRIDDYCLALDLENSAIMISALIPWNIALLVPMTILGSGATCIPFLIYIYILPLWNLIFLKYLDRNALMH